jgi:hypothetical protein
MAHKSFSYRTKSVVGYDKFLTYQKKKWDWRMKDKVSDNKDK